MECQEAFEILHGAGSPVLITCEHASNRLPPPWRWPEADAWITELHWAWDIGARDMSLELAAALGSTAVLPRFTRLLIDPNRPLDSDTLFRDTADAKPVYLNRELADDDADRRVQGYYSAFHGAVGAQGRRVNPRFLLSIHSFTPVYEGAERSVEIGVLHAGGAADLAARWRDILARTGRDVRVDEPYQGAGGFMFSAWHHSTTLGCDTLELEIRNDILADPTQRPRLIDMIKTALKETGYL